MGTAKTAREFAAIFLQVHCDRDISPTFSLRRSLVFARQIIGGCCSSSLAERYCACKEKSKQYNNDLSHSIFVFRYVRLIHGFIPFKTTLRQPLCCVAHSPKHSWPGRPLAQMILAGGRPGQPGPYDQVLHPPALDHASTENNSLHSNGPLLRYELSRDYGNRASSTCVPCKQSLTRVRPILLQNDRVLI